MASKTVFITGASAGLGRQMAKEFARRGYALGLAARQIDALQDLKAEIEGQCKVGVFVYQLDVRDSKLVRRTVEQAATDLGGLDVVIANAGISTYGRVGFDDFAGTRGVVEVNVIGAMATVDAAVRLFLEQGHGHVVAMSSVAAWRGVPGSGAYSASKAALTTYMDAVSTEVLGKGIRTTVIYPGFIDTDINKSIKQRPFLLSAEEGGRRIVEAIERGDSRAVVPAMPWRALFPVLKGLSNPLMRKAFGSGA